MVDQIRVIRIGNPFELLDRDVSREIDDDAARRHSAASYLIKQVGQIDESARREAFQIPDTVIGIEEARVSYEGTLKVIDRLVASRVQPIGVHVFNTVPGKSKPSHPAVTIGLAKFSPPLPEGEPTEHQAHLLNLSEKGQRIIDRYLELLGQPTIQEQFEQNKARWNSGLAADQ